MRFRLRTLMIVLAIAPPLLAGGWWAYNRLAPQTAAQTEQERLKAIMDEFDRLMLKYPSPPLEEPAIGYHYPQDPPPNR